MGQFFENIAQWFSSMGADYYQAFIAQGRYMAYLNGLKNTLLISFFAILIGVVIGVFVAVVKVSLKGNKKFRWAYAICNGYINLIRGTPMVLQILIMYNMIFTSRDSNPLLIGAVCFGINSGAYVAEIVRAGIESIDLGQSEAGRSLGLNHFQTMWYIVLPQAVKNILPTLGNEFIVLIKETAVAGYIAVTDLTKAAQYVGSVTYKVLPPLIIAAVIYLILVMILTKILRFFERRMAQGAAN